MSKPNYKEAFPCFDNMLISGTNYGVDHDKIDAKSHKKAKEELHEDAKERDNALAQLRQWVSQQPHLSMCTDTLVLLQFLRRCKFSQLEARRMLDNFVTMTCKHLPEFMCNYNIDKPGIKKMFKDGLVTMLPKRDHEGRRIFIWKWSAIDVDKVSAKDIISYFGMILVCMQREEETQINGYVLIDDQSNMTMKHMTIFGIERLKHFVSIFTGKFPSRIKSIVWYNAGKMGEFFLMNILKPVMPQKLHDRLHHYGTMEELYKVFPMHLWPTEYLPDDYKGPSAGSGEEIRAYMYQQMSRPEVKRRFVELSTKLFRLDEKKRPAEAETEVAAFRKLNID